MRAVAALLLVLALSLFAPRSEATTYVTPAAAQAACIAQWNIFVAQNNGNAGDSSCILWNNSVVTQPVGFYGITGHCCGAGFTFQWNTGFVPPNQCSTAAPVSGAFSGQLAQGAPMCGGQPDGSGCAMTFTPDSPSFMNRAGTMWATHGTYRPSGSQCTPGAVGQGNAPPPAAAPARSCGGGSCYDSANKQFCAVDGSGAQVCVPGSAAASSNGACVSSSSATVCAGTPNAPAPPAPPASPISDPPTQVQSSDKYTTSSPSTGTQTTTVNSYSPGQGLQSGKQSSDDGPASSSTAPSKPGTYGGGADCNSPPMCTGDAVMCGIARQEWYAMCSAKAGTDQLHKDLAGDGSTPPQGGTHTGTDLNGGSVDTGDTSQLDASGFGWGTACPFNDLTIQIGGTTQTISFQPVCDYGVYMRGFVLLLAAFTCAGILGGFKAGSMFGGG
ncbi:virulence factor TspB C-terminal domain-related protein [Dyella soli]|uniref:Uncharacterized protein n=1 Tax=Dyella soli TaxID=522319 RepID=A0A4R0YUE7_9GAMM|nr:virulence factor TspB C-terminal domain-related protein [Dyella soli]TCI10132.1 hypothetical protein EZM97_14530 [Dyella soli]